MGNNNKRNLGARICAYFLSVSEKGGGGAWHYSSYGIITRKKAALNTYV